MSRQDELKLDTFYKVAQLIATQAGEQILKNFSYDVIPEWKADGSPLTKTDIEINTMVIDTIKKNFPTHAVLGEEENHNFQNNEYVWCCDPIDGTVPFAHGLPLSTFSLALLKNGEPIIGIVNEPYRNLLFSAIKGQGAYLNNKRKLRVNNYKKLTSKVIFVDGLAIDTSVYNAISAKKAFTCSYLSFIYGAKQVATGHFIGAIYYGTKPWDVATIKIIVEEAGGLCTSINGKTQRYDKPIDGFVASNRIVHDELIAITLKNV